MDSDPPHFLPSMGVWNEIIYYFSRLIVKIHFCPWCLVCFSNSWYGCACHCSFLLPLCTSCVPCFLHNLLFWCKLLAKLDISICHVNEIERHKWWAYIIGSYVLLVELQSDNYYYVINLSNKLNDQIPINKTWIKQNRLFSVSKANFFHCVRYLFFNII